MTKWDTIQADLAPITPRVWGDEHEFDKDLDEDEMEFLNDLEQITNQPCAIRFIIGGGLWLPPHASRVKA